MKRITDMRSEVEEAELDKSKGIVIPDWVTTPHQLEIYIALIKAAYWKKLRGETE